MKEKVMIGELFKKQLWLFLVPLVLLSCQSAPKTQQNSAPQKKTFTCLEQRFVVIGIDEPSEKKLGPFPWSRQVLADSLARLKPAKTVVIAFTLDRKQSARVDRQLERAVAAHKGIVLQARPVPRGSASIRLYQRNLPHVAPNRVSYRTRALMVPYTALRDRASAMGFRLSSMGSDAAFPIVMVRAGEVYPSLALSALMSHYGLDRRHVRSGGGRLALGRKQTEPAKLNSFPNPCASAKVAYYSFIDLKRNKVPAQRLRGRVVVLSLARLGKTLNGANGGKLYHSPLVARLVSLFSWYEH